jgi:hypothetical protein
VAISLTKFQIPKSNFQTNPNIKILNSKPFEHWDLVLGIQDFPFRGCFVDTAPGNDKKEVALKY